MKILRQKNLAGTEIRTRNLSTRNVLTLPTVFFATATTTFWLNTLLGPLK